MKKSNSLADLKVSNHFQKSPLKNYNILFDNQKVERLNHFPIYGKKAQINPIKALLPNIQRHSITR